MSEYDLLRESFEEELEDASFPIESPMDLVPVLSQGPMTSFEGEDVSISAMELMNYVNPYVDEAPNEGFPYNDLESLLDDIFYALEEENIV